MLYPTFNQPLLLLCIAIAGFLCGLIFDAANFLLFAVKKKKFLSQLLYFFAIIISSFVLFFVNLKINYGQFRLFTLFEFITFLLIERFTLGILWTKALDKCYNKLTRVGGKIIQWTKTRKAK